jgi:hypothetical protein
MTVTEGPYSIEGSEQGKGYVYINDNNTLSLLYYKENMGFAGPNIVKERPDDI